MNDNSRPAQAAWLVGGESGVGKSRLIEEIRIRALVHGALVLTGQAISEGSIPYQIWRDPLRRLALSIDLTDEDASVLKTLVPDIDTLLEHIVPESPALDPQASRGHFLRVVTDMFRTLKQPTVVILEDLQWASDESLELLKHLIPLSADLPLMWIASYRDDERPELAEPLSAMRLIKLPRLDETRIADLSESILGAAGRNPQIVNWLYQQTEGNVFFLVENVRELAAKAGELDLIDAAHLPDHLLPQGIQSVVQRRLNRVPEDARPLLQVAALAGRELDLDLLSTFRPDLASWLQECSTVLDTVEDRWRFAHDKLREGVMSTVAVYDLPGLHRKLAERLEQVHPDDPVYIPAIARHSERAGLFDKAAHYFAQAAELAQKAYANKEAIGLALGALNAISHLLEDDPTLSQWLELRFRLYEMLGSLHGLAGQQDEARTWFQQGLAQPYPADALQPARLYRKFANTWVAQRQPEKAVPILERAEEALTGLENVSPTAWWMEWIEIQLEGMWINYWRARPQVMAQFAEKVRPKIDLYATPRQRSRFLRSIVLVDFQMYISGGLPEETLAIAQSAVVAARESTDLLEVSIAQNTLGLTYLFYEDWENAEREFQISLKLSERIGQVEYRIIALTYLSISHRRLGREDLAAQFTELLMTAASEKGMMTYVGVAKANQAWLAWRKNNFAQTQELGQAAMELWRQFATPFPMQWTARWPLIGVASKVGDVAQMIDYIKGLFAPLQVTPREPLARLLTSALDAWEKGDTTLAQTHIADAMELARQLNFL